MNVMEEALLDIKETSATLISNQQQDKTEVVKEIDKWKRSMNQSCALDKSSIFFESFLISLSFSLSFFSKSSLVFIIPDD
jgi:hypothetical protein